MVDCEDCYNVEECIDARLEEEDFEEMSNAEKLEEIKSGFETLLAKADDIVEDEGGIIESRAKAYWLPIIANLLNSEYEGCSMQKTIDEINER